MTIRIGSGVGDVDYEVGAFFDELAAAPPFGPPGGYPMALPSMFNRTMYPPSYGPGIPSRRIMPTIPGAPALGAKLQPLGFTPITFTATSGTALSATTRPQKPFKGRRLVVDVARTGVTSTGLLTVTSITIGVNNQLVSQQPVGVGAFIANGQDCNVSLSACSSALDIAVNYSILIAPTTTDTVSLSTTLFGETVGS